jgi:hypothetical protein
VDGDSGGQEGAVVVGELKSVLVLGASQLGFGQACGLLSKLRSCSADHSRTVSGRPMSRAAPPAMPGQGLRRIRVSA